MKKYPFYSQHDLIDCGPTCLKMIAKYYGKEYSLEFLRQQCFLTKEGVSLLSINDAAEKLGFRTMLAFLTFEQLLEDAPLPCILHWNQDHFVVLYRIKKHIATIGDPAHGVVNVDKETLIKAWTSTSKGTGAILLLEPSLAFFQAEGMQRSNSSYRFLLQYFSPFKRYIAQLLVGMVAATLISLALPVFMQLMIDEGVGNKNKSLVFFILISQLLLFIGSTLIETVRSWLILHINARISLNVISDFLNKLLKLPIKYFDSKTIGDISQRLGDHHRIETFLTGSLLSSIFSIINIIFFTIIIAFYSISIFLIYLLLSLLGIVWIFLFQKRRKKLDYKRFARNRENQDRLYEMITGMEEIKLHAGESYKRWDWERLQIKYYKLNIKSLALEQYQKLGFTFFTSLKNIAISFVAANEAIEGKISLGVLLSISYIVGQTNGPIEQLVTFVKSAQDARLSVERLQEIHRQEEEEEFQAIKKDALDNDDIHVNNLSYQYEGPRSPFVLKNVSLTIPKGKITAIVGESGSGKTTLMKMLLGYYEPIDGTISIGSRNLSSISPKIWRKECGSVLQNGYIFSDTIAKNIALNGISIDKIMMEKAITVANLKGFVEQLPLRYTTKIGPSGKGLSGGQRQRILIARAVYKDPSYLFFDEATSSLDASNERLIMENLYDFFKDRTVLIIAHRLSTVKYADQIIVLDRGRIVESGNHESLVAMKGKYFNLVKNQLELSK